MITTHFPTTHPRVPLSHYSIDDAFQASVDCRNIVLDKFKLPEDNCKLMATVIEKGTAIAAVLNKVILIDIIRQKRIAAALGMNNARECYDHILHSVAILVLISFRVAGETAQAMVKVLHEVKHHIKTGFERSERAYGNGPVSQQGNGQGNGI